MSEAKGRKNKPKLKKSHEKSRRAHQRTRPFIASQTNATASQSDAQREWQRTRHGAWASRGFSFQHSVSAWIAAELLSGEREIGALVPEGLEDLTIDGQPAQHVQIKSRAGSRVGFSTTEAADYILNCWQRQRRRLDQATLVLVLEQEVKGESFGPEFNQFLHDLRSDSPLRTSVREKAHERGWGDDLTADILYRTAVCVIDWPTLDDLTEQALRVAAPLSAPVVRRYLARELRSLVSDAASANAKVSQEQRRQFTKTDLARHVTEFMRSVDSQSLEAAVRDGVCEPVSLSQRLDIGDRFYEGVATQPGHVAAGLVTPRDDLISMVLAGIERDGTTVLTGPAGVGKSAVLWSIPHAAPGVLWFQVHRLMIGDVEPIIGLARAYLCSPVRPLGLLIDFGVGEDPAAWRLLREKAGAIPGLCLVAAVRSEDVVLLGDLNGCTSIAVSLNESAAAAIYEGLKRRGSTELAHWKEAYDASDQLTLEYTYLLTNGRRLRDVVADQISQRLRDNRLEEIDVVSLVAMADHWGAALGVEALSRACSLTALQLKRVLTRLMDEHLVSERSGMVHGVHPLRSRAISDSIYLHPPPSLDQSFTRLLVALDTSQITPFVTNALRAEPELAEAIPSGVRTAVQARDWERVAAFLRGLRLYDSWVDATKWMGIADKYQVARNLRPLLFVLGVAEKPWVLTSDEQMVAACHDISVSPRSSLARGVVNGMRLPWEIATGISECPDLDVVGELLFEIGPLADRDADGFIRCLDHDTVLGKALATVDVFEWGTVVSSAREVHPEIAMKYYEVCGGSSRLFELVRRDNPWITDLDLVHRESDVVVTARILHVSDAINGDAHERVVGLARQLLSCVPHATQADIRVVVPGGADYRIGDYEHGVTALKARYNQPERVVARNRERIRLARLLLGGTDTERLAAALPLLQEAGDLLEVAVRCFATQSLGDLDAYAFADRCNELGERAGDIRPRLGVGKLLDPLLIYATEGSAEPLIAPDHLTGIITDIVGNVIGRLANESGYVGLASHIEENVVARSLSGAKSEPWHLLGMKTYPQELDKIHTILSALLRVLGTIAHNPSARAVVTHAAKRGGSQNALKRAARTADKIAESQILADRGRIIAACEQVGLSVHVLMPSVDKYELVPEVGILVPLGSVLSWSDNVDAVVGAIESLDLGSLKLTLIPMKAGRPVEQLVMVRLRNTWPTATLGVLGGRIAEPWTLPILNAFDEAIHSLQVRSGLQIQMKQRSDVTLFRELVYEHESAFTSALSELQGVKDDPVLSHLSSDVEFFVQRVRSEAECVPSGVTFAEELWATSTPSSDGSLAAQVLFDRALAIEWTTDRQAAQFILASLR